VDVGAGFGALGPIVNESGRLSYIGFEPSISVAEVARRRGVDMRAELFGRDSLPEPVGAVVLDNVIEHLADPGLPSWLTAQKRCGRAEYWS
jgi:hypothetical protein